MVQKSLHKRVLKWGNSFGIRLTRADLEELGIREDSEVDVNLELCKPNVDWDRLPDLGLPRDASTRHDEIIGQGIVEEHG